ncbi:MAG: hypothetical protein AAGL34_17805, partial [Bacteroidota bacterium]
MRTRTLLLLALFLSLTTTILGQDFDGDLILDNIDLDDDNDGILDSNECQIPIANFSFDNGPTPSLFGTWLRLGGAPGNVGTESLVAGNVSSVPDGNQFLYINSGLGSVGATLNVVSDVYEATNYQLSLFVGDGIGLGGTNDDGDSFIQMGYGDDAGGFTAIPGADITVLGTTTADDSWNLVTLNFTIPVGSPALGEGILVRIIHDSSAPGAGTQGKYDNVQLVKDTDGDGDPDCTDLDSDNDGCNDVVEAGHVDAGGGVLGFLPNVDGNGQVTGAGGYTGNQFSVLDLNTNVCAANYLDNDSDGVPDATDIDDDNDGIEDIYECEIPVLNHSFEDSPAGGPPPVPNWNFFTPIGGGVEFLQPPPAGSPNYHNAPDGIQFAFVNGSGAILMNTPYAVFELGGYSLTVAVGDGIDRANSFRNDGTTLLELGYDNGGGFTPIGPGLTINPGETPNGIWKDFTYNVNVPAGPAIGESILIRISHTENVALNQQAGNYDNIRLVRDTDGDGISNCFDLDSDNDGCNDVVEAGHTDSGSGTLAGSGIDPTDGTVTGAADGYLGNVTAVLDATVDGCTIVDFDGDTYADGDRFYYTGPGNTRQTDVDRDNDNDGINDLDEDCNLTLEGISREPYNFELPANNFLGGPFASGPGAGGFGVLDFWTASDITLIGGHRVNVDQFIDPATTQPYPKNYKTDGTGLTDFPDPDYRNDTFAFINETATLTQRPNAARNPVIQEGHYILTIAIGDGVDLVDRFRNDGQSVIEMGYNVGGVFTPLPRTDGLGSSLVVEGHETPNGAWTDFSLSVEATPASIGELLLVRITHNADLTRNQGAGNYDYLRINFDYDGDGAPDCLDFDSDDDGCPDVTEAEFANDDNDNFLGTGVPAVDGDGRVTGFGGYTLPVNPNVRSFAEPAVIDTPLTGQNICEGGNATFTVGASRVGGGVIEYEWFESTDGGVTFTPLAETTNT